MKIYTTDKIRNVVLLGHSGSGKTSMVEAIAKIAKITDKMGSIDAGNTISDFGKEEQKRKISCQASVIPLEWDSRKINVIDTPGFSDFIGEVEMGKEEFESMLENERREWSQEDWDSLGKIIEYFEEGYDWLVLTCY